MCEFNNPDCLNCPYPDCNASVTDMRRQWSCGYKENVDQYLRETLYDSLSRRQAKYNKTEKGKIRQARYSKSEKGKANERRKSKRKIESGQNAEYCRRYSERQRLSKMQVSL